MKFKYYIATFDHGTNQLVYLSHDEEGHCFSGIMNSISFDTYDSVLNYMLDPVVSQFLDCGCCIVHVADCAIEKAMDDIELWKKLHDPCYVL